MIEILLAVAAISLLGVGVEKAGRYVYDIWEMFYLNVIVNPLPREFPKDFVKPPTPPAPPSGQQNEHFHEAVSAVQRLVDKANGYIAEHVLDSRYCCYNCGLSAREIRAEGIYKCDRSKRPTSPPPPPVKYDARHLANWPDDDRGSQ